MKILQKELFSLRQHPIKVKDVLLVFLLLLLLLLLCQCSKGTNKPKSPEEAVEDTCLFPKQTMKALDELLQRADFCSEVWFEDVASFRSELEQQTKALKKKSDSTSKALYQKQEVLLKAFKAFEKKQDEASLNALEKAFKAYQVQSKKGCSDK